MMDLVIKNNNFSFNGQHFLQTEETAIGSHLGMNYACTYLRHLEENLFQNSNLHPYSYWGYVDDILGIWEHGLDELKTNHELSNNLHPRIQTEMRYSTEKNECLDVFVNIENGELKQSFIQNQQINTSTYRFRQAIQILSKMLYLMDSVFVLKEFAQQKKITK
ncbi:unnamed protein product [Mytilus coruscus]|uniref:Reverse transcriptase domain-containing protein n=1 Tax=Mytilus coruscus TaxID=42192 RepID=A0A6J8ETB2_MYTCO|nr:unnamed protein product [Mytilus coruscus]